MVQWSDVAGLEDPQTILRPLANHMRPMLINSIKQRRKALFTENAEKMKRLLDNLQKQLDEVSTVMIDNYIYFFNVLSLLCRLFFFVFVLYIPDFPCLFCICYALSSRTFLTHFFLSFACCSRF